MLSLKRSINKLNGLSSVGGPSSALSVVGAPARLFGGPSAATNIPVVHTLLMATQ